MPAMPPPVDTELAGLVAFLAQQQQAFRAAAYGLTDEQARQTPTAGTLSIGGLVKHVAHVQFTWTQKILAAPAPGPSGERASDEFVLRDDETLAGVLDVLAAQNAATVAAIEAADLDARVPVPRSAPWFPQDVEAWNVRWVVLHLVEELARHAGHADVVRESIDGATMYELVAAAEGWEPTSWLTPWRPGRV